MEIDQVAPTTEGPSQSLPPSGVAWEREYLHQNSAKTCGTSSAVPIR